MGKFRFPPRKFYYINHAISVTALVAGYNWSPILREPQLATYMGLHYNIVF